MITRISIVLVLSAATLFGGCSSMPMADSVVSHPTPPLPHMAKKRPEQTAVVRGQSPDWDGRRPMTPAAPGAPTRVAQNPANLWNGPTQTTQTSPLPPPTAPPLAPANGASANGPTGVLDGVPTITNVPPGVIAAPPGQPADIHITVEEAPTGRFMLGAGVNSDAGVTGQIIIDEQNFNWKRIPRSFDDIVNGTAFRGGGQRLRIEAIPGSRVQRYMVNFVEPYLFESRVSLSLSGFLFDRNYFDWDERRVGGRMGLGYRLTPDLSANVSLRGENVEIRNPRVRGVPGLERVLGNNELWSGRMTLTHDTRDVPFFPTEGHLLEMSFEQVFGTYDYPRGVIDYRKYLLLAERPDGSGRHVWANSLRFGFSGSDTPLFENFFAGGHTTMRGFDFRGASPKVGSVTVGGTFSMLGSSEYIFPITADDMLRGVLFCDYGTIEEEIEINTEDFRVAAGFGLRVTVPAMGPAPIALDFAVPITREDTDEIQNFSFYVGFGR